MQGSEPWGSQWDVLAAIALGAIIGATARYKLATWITVPPVRSRGPRSGPTSRVRWCSGSSWSSSSNGSHPPGYAARLRRHRFPRRLHHLLHVQRGDRHAHQGRSRWDGRRLRRCEPHGGHHHGLARRPSWAGASPTSATHEGSSHEARRTAEACHHLRRRVRPRRAATRWPSKSSTAAHAAGMAGASMFRGVEGYGASNHLHTTRILSLSDVDLPDRDRHRRHATSAIRSVPARARRAHHRRASSSSTTSRSSRTWAAARKGDA